MDFLIDNLWVLWLIVGAVMLLIEVSTAALVSIWFVFAAVLTAVVASFWDNFIAQVILFFVLSGAFLLLFRNVYKKKLQNGKASDVSDYTLLGKTATVSETVTPYEGKVLVGDVFWRAVSEDGTELPKGTVVSITGQDGTTLKVKAK